MFCLKNIDMNLYYISRYIFLTTLEVLGSIIKIGNVSLLKYEEEKERM